ncbi:MAG: nicotinamide riboside transporter PnuC [Verrucomicrobiota bacterium]
MSGALQHILDGFATASGLDLANMALGLAGVALMIRRSLWAFPVGLVAVSVQGVLFWRSRFPADALLQVFYFGALVWGWRHWVKDRGPAAELPITRLPPAGIAITLVAAGAATAGWAVAVGPWMQAAMPWRDAFIAAFSVAAQILQVRKNLENWALWAVVNAVAIASYWGAELAFTAFLYGVYLVLGLLGWWQWARAMRKQS